MNPPKKPEVTTLSDIGLMHQLLDTIQELKNDNGQISLSMNAEVVLHNLILAVRDVASQKAVQYVEHHCEICEDSGFSKAGTGYDAVCDACGGQSVHLDPPRGLADALASRLARKETP